MGDWLEISQQRIDQFAAVTEDHQWLHNDLERAQRESPFKTTIAHGFLTLSLLPRLTDSVNPEKSPYPECQNDRQLWTQSGAFSLSGENRQRGACAQSFN